MSDGSDVMVFVLIISAVIGLVTAFLGSIAGLGGGVILVPSLLFLYQISDAFSWATPQKIVGISLVVMIFTGLSSAISYMKSRRVDFKSGGIFLLGSIPGSIVGSYLVQFLGTERFSILFGILMLLVSMMFFIPRKKRAANNMAAKGFHRSMEIDGHTYNYSYSVVIGCLLAFSVGMMSGLFGIGGGSLMVPAMILLFGFPAHIATATSMFMIFFMSISSSITHIYLGHVDWLYTLAFIPGAYIGGTLGARVNRHLKGKYVEWVLRGLLFLIAFRLIWQGLG
ncbi:sulfite exporter TauE/SafE family protein [Thalassobacillus pellis]|uniref:sulfite exporter TauE/SafE family protein n=1 Tax=Thalassobacillus pellis TaxID=748008 RepID=UPI001EF885C4|nr:sulfite exporter TauE/SafE family protein [Thalassobacillus pellis]MBM7554896.1 putative membrane protein YfcA [Thalassobacillus pellis]